MMKLINTKRRDFIVKTSSAAAAVAVGGSLAACSDSGADEEKFAAAPEFNYGVASGDPLTDRIILWTHAKFPGADAALAVPLTWQIATDVNFSSVINSGKVDASDSTGFAAKVDATGLTAGVDYFYRFQGPRGSSSAVGTTRTLPAANVASLKFAVFSCSLYSEGFFNAYDAAAKSDAQYAIHLGDYIYEYGAAATQFGNTDAVTLGRVTVPATDIVTLADYRARYALYRSDVAARALHAKMPWITIWDDHEFANNAYVNGAENHNPATQGDWNTRKNIAARVYHEWMPIRTDTGDLLKIYRSFDFGSLFSLHMLDTRIEGRDQQYDNFGDKDGGVARYIIGITPNAVGVLPDQSRRMISATQQSWLTTQLTASRATWQFLGNQDIMARMWIPVSVAQYFNPANAGLSGCESSARGRWCCRTHGNADNTA
jgi:alkaline phosphatase D